MARYDQHNAECHVFTYKEGLLSAVAHDLKIGVERFTVEVGDDLDSVRATFDAGSLKCVCAVKDGREKPGTLSAKDLKQIDDNTRNDVLAVRKHPEIRFRSTSVEPAGDGYRVRGELTIKGRTRSINVGVAREGDRFVTTLRIHQSDYGVKPFSALLGALKIKPDIDVRLSVPVNA